jgi:hypothetical protein
LVAHHTRIAQGVERMSSEQNVQTVRELLKAFYAADDEAMTT